MSELIEAMDTFFNRRPAPSHAEMKRLKAENKYLRGAVRRAHTKLAKPGHSCICAVCSDADTGVES